MTMNHLCTGPKPQKYTVHYQNKYTTVNAMSRLGAASAVLGANDTATWAYDEKPDSTVAFCRMLVNNERVSYGPLTVSEAA